MSPAGWRARRSGSIESRSAVARDILTLGLLNVATDDRTSEARRQSRLVSRRDSERDSLRFIIDAADLRGWR